VDICRGEMQSLVVFVPIMNNKFIHLERREILPSA